MAIAAQVLYRNLVEAAVDAALEQAESVLHRIRVRVTPAVGPAVMDGLVLGIEVPLEIDRIGSGLIRVDRARFGTREPGVVCRPARSSPKLRLSCLS
jgi:hypothetical protein